MLTGDILRHSAQRSPKKTALIDDGQQLSYADFDADANRLAHALLGFNLSKGAKVGIMSANRAEYAIAYFGIARTGYVSAHVSARSTAEDLAYVLDKVDAEVLLFESQFTDVVHEALPGVPSLVHLVTLDNAATRKPAVPGVLSFTEMLQNQPATDPAVDIAETDPLAITFTGGTTGFPKAVLVTHQARCATAYAAAADLGLDERDILAVSTPLFHTAGLFVWFVTGIMLGATVVMQRGWDPMDFTDLAERHAVTAGFLVPSQLNDLISHHQFDATRLQSLRKMGYAGAPMAPALLARIYAALPALEYTENYGQSETCPITVLCPSHPKDKRGTVGRVACNVDLRVVDPEGNALPAGDVGEITVRSDTVFTEYYGDPEQTAAAFPKGDGWLWTGDVGFLDDDGFLTLVDRSKDMLVSGGENVYPAEIENALYRHDAVAECAVFGIPDERWGEVPAAHVVLAPGASVTAEELMDFCASKIARFKRPRLIKFVDSLPRTPIGKIQKVLIREPYWQDHDKNI